MGIPGSALRELDSAHRVAVVGSVGCGKSTLARELARRAKLPYVELDALRYQANWTKTAERAYYDDVVRVAGTGEWLIDGNYEITRDIVWVRAQLLVWLDYPLRLVLWRLLRRTVKRLLTREVFANGNRENFWRLFGRDSIFLWALRSHGPRRKKFAKLLATTRYAHLRVLRFYSPREVDAWLAKHNPNGDKQPESLGRKHGAASHIRQRDQ
jgi:adenylate kinase family enzyme